MRVALPLLLAGVTGCAAVHRPPATYAELAAAEAPAAVQQAALRSRVVDRLVERAVRGDPRAATLFDKSWMADLEQVGYDQSRSAAPWAPALEID